MSEKLQLSIFKINDKGWEKLGGKPAKEVDISVEFLERKLKAQKYKTQKTKDIESEKSPELKKTDEFEPLLFYKRNPSEVKWKDFIKDVAKSGEEILKHNSTYNESYVLLFKQSSQNTFYAVTGGYGHMAIQEYASSDFGLEVLSRLLTSADKALKSVKEKNITGGILGAVKFFRQDYNLNENESFGKIYNELHASLDVKKVQTTFGLSPTEISKNCLCVAKNSFALKKSISYKQLVRIIENCNRLIQRKSISEINSIKKLDKSDKALIAELDEKLSEKVYDIFTGKSDEEVEICHPEFDKYLLADTCAFSYYIKKDVKIVKFESPVRLLSELLSTVKEIPKKDKPSFDKIMSQSYLTSFDEDDKVSTEALLKKYYTTEIKLGLNSYFFINGDWFHIKSKFIEKLNNQCKLFISTNMYKGLNYSWNYLKESENEFNSKFIGEADTLVFDKITPENVEVCDVLKWDDENIYFIHNKAGFSNSMRDLCQQITIAARLIQEDKLSNYSFLKKLINATKNNKGITPYYLKIKKEITKITEEDFLKLFETRKPVFVLGVLDTAKKTRKIQDIEKFDSNIAKYSIHELNQFIKGLGFDLKVAQISKI